MAPPNAAFRSTIQRALARLPLQTPNGVVLDERRTANWGYRGGKHRPVDCWVYRPLGSSTEVLFGFQDNFSPHDLMCRAQDADEVQADGRGATLQLNGHNCVLTNGRGQMLIHSGSVTVGSAVKRARLLTLMEEHAPPAFDALFAAASKPWPIVLGTTADVPALLDRLALYAFAVEQAKRAIRGERPLPSMTDLGGDALGVSTSESQDDPESEAFEELDDEATGEAQGFASPAHRTAVERWAMTAAIEYFGARWTDVRDVSGAEPYDLCCLRGDEVAHVEVKGTTSDGSAIFLTANEVLHAQTVTTVLFVVSEIEVHVDGGGELWASGGVINIRDPWDIEQDKLIPVQYRCLLAKLE